MDEAIRQRDLEWKEELEIRDQLWRDDSRKDMRTTGKGSAREMMI